MSELQQTVQTIGRAARRYLSVARLTPPLPLLLILGPALGALVLATAGQPRAGSLLGLLLIALCLWGAARSFNDLINASRGDDAHSLIRCGVLTQHQAVVLLITLLVVALGTALLLHVRVFVLALLPLLVAALFPWLRRNTYLVEAWLGLGVAWPVVMAYAIAGGWPNKVGALLGLVTLLWVMGWLVLEQWPRHSELLGRGYRSLGLMFGASTGYLVIALQASALLGAWMAGTQAQLGAVYHAAWLLAAAALAWQALLLHRKGSAASAMALRLHLLGGVAIWLGVILHFAAAR